MSEKVENAKKRGRPEVDSEAVTIRLPRDVVTALDAARLAVSAQFPPSRTEVVRAVLVDWLKTKGNLRDPKS